MRISSRAKSFRYLLDPLCLLACLAYVLNRAILEPASTSAFLHGTFNDLLLIPAALPPVLWLQRRLGWRVHHRPPTPGEILTHWLVWSIVCEGIGPLFLPRAVGDWRDIAAYAVGALLAGLWWNRARLCRTGCDLLAPHYHGMEAVLAGEKLQRGRIAHLDKLPPCENALLAGEGHGRFLVELRKSQPATRITCVDSRAGMLDVARTRLRRSGLPADRVTFLHHDLLDWNPPASAFDLIITNFFLDCFTAEQLGELIARLARAARPGAVWLVADFQIPPPGSLRHIRARIIHWLMYRFFRLATRRPAAALTPPDPFLERNGFILRHRCEFDCGRLSAEVWEKTLLQTSVPTSVIPP